MFRGRNIIDLRNLSETTERLLLRPRQPGTRASIVLSSITKKGEIESASRLSLVGFGVDDENN